MTKLTFFLLSGDYATESGKALSNLNPELRAIENRIKAISHFDVISKQRAAYNDLLQVVKQHNAIYFFHYNGHANSENIFLQSDKLEKETLSVTQVTDLLAIQQKPIKLAILNGCVSEGQAEAFLAIGVDFVIATNRLIGDYEARTFADKFYENFLLATHNLIETLHLSLIELYKTAEQARNSIEKDHYTFMTWYDDDFHFKECPYNLYIRKGADKNWGLGEEISIVKKQALLPAPPSLENKLYDSDTGVLLGRKEELKDIHELLQNEKALILMNGMGGIGKSTLAAAYAHIYKAFYTHISYVTVLETDDNVKQAIIRTFKDAFELWEMSNENLPAAILHRLQSYNKERLLIIDNANSEDAILAAKPYLNSLDWKVLFTSRSYASGITHYEIHTLHPDDALVLFRLHCPRKHSLADIQTLLANVLYHTLLVEFMAKTLELNADVPIQELLAITANANFTDELLSFTKMTTNHQDFTSHTQSLIVVSEYLIQIFPVQGLNEEEQKYLLYFSILPSKFIAFDTLLQLFDVEMQTNEKLRCKEPLQSLYSKGWLQYDETEGYYCHPLLQHLIRQQLKPNAENCEVIIESLIWKFKTQGIDNPLDRQIWLPYGIAVLHHIKENTNKISALSNNIAETYRAIGDMQQALAFGLKSLKIMEEILSPTHPDLATSYNNIALTYRAMGNMKKALAFGLKSLTICQQILSPTHPNLAKSYNNIAETYRLIGDVQQALVFGLNSLAIREQIFPFPHPDLALSYNNLAATHNTMGNFQQALAYCLKDLAIQEQILSPTHPYLINSYNEIAITYAYLKEWELSLSYMKKVIIIWKQLLLVEHPHLKKSLDSMSVILKDAKGEVAKEVYEEYKQWFEGL